MMVGMVWSVRLLALGGFVFVMDVKGLGNG